METFIAPALTLDEVVQIELAIQDRFAILESQRNRAFELGCTAEVIAFYQTRIDTLRECMRKVSNGSCSI